MTTAVNKTQYHTNQPVRWLYRLLAFTLLDCLVTILFLIWAQQSTRLPDNIKADGAVLLFAGMGDQERINESHRRINRAYQLYQNDVVEEILSTGGYRPGQESGSTIYKKELRLKGVPETALSTEALSYDTVSNLDNALSIIEDKHWKQVVFVSSPTHLLRVKHYLQHRNLDIEVYYASFDYQQASPSIDLLELWLRVHNEWAIYLMYNLLDESTFNTMVRSIRIGSQVANA